MNKENKKLKKAIGTKKIKKPRTEKVKAKTSSNINDELKKVSHQMSAEQTKRPKKILFLVCFYVIIAFAVLVLFLIILNRTNKINIEKTANNEETLPEYFDEYAEETTSKFLYTKETTIYELTNKETATEKVTTVEEIATESEVETTVEEIATESETETTVKKTTDEKVTENDITEKGTLATASLKKKNTSSKNTIAGLLPKYQEVLYSYPMFYQFSSNDLSIINKTISDKFKGISDQIFGEVDLDLKAKNGIIYYNLLNLNEYLKANNDDIKHRYEVLPKTSYYSYIMQDKFGYDENTFTTNLKASFDFRNAQEETDYYEIPTLFYEPDGNTKEVKTRFLKKATIGFSESFLLTSKLQVLDDEWHTVNNPYFMIEECVGENPVAATKLQKTVFKIDEMLKYTKFNYIVFDKKGYITSAFLIN